ncbi:hypothetical protein LQG66_08670 [Bradyrhizobium ontarionense]|uniref:Uncharacterized protein n=1 Tax=Bradyrhizobium ontarionense TaxID=2898149 RepID=A0ABY3RHP9_9BRAD|nr:hypothetical protein [Bradyrhizobium sp. A19]UFZ06353.1 hypothetical protein LQG66_08670 [Bradyrhizobium sp. A19]
MYPRLAACAAFALMLFVTQQRASGQDCACGPDFCQGDPRYAPRLAKAKAAMRNEGYPEDLIALMDKGGACFARIDRAPVNFHIRVYTANASEDVEWNEDNDRIARTNLLNGKINGYFKFNTLRAFKCCGEKEYNERADYDSDHDVNRSIAIQCLKSGGSVACQ